MRPTADDLIAELRAHGHRVTRARRAICDALAAAVGEHVTATEIAERVPDIDPSTVYRTLDALQDLGLVGHLHLGHGAGAYHLAPERPHHHLVCDECGRTVDVPVAELQRAVEGVTGPHGFVPDLTHFAIVGRCARCVARSGE